MPQPRIRPKGDVPPLLPVFCLPIFAVSSGHLPLLLHLLPSAPRAPLMTKWVSGRAPLGIPGHSGRDGSGKCFLGVACRQ